MPRIEPLPREAFAEMEDMLEMVEATMGFVPNSMLTMGRLPGLVQAFAMLGATVVGNSTIEPGLAQMVGMMASVGGGCRYCQAHTGHGAERAGVEADKLAAIWDFETDDRFSQAERAALRVAFHSGQVPNAVTDAEFATLREHWSDEEVAAIVAVCAFFGYLNRWNDTMATQLEASPMDFGERVLTDQGWDAAKHR
jgi:alkylhydroperoxidase family enzyme